MRMKAARIDLVCRYERPGRPLLLGGRPERVLVAGGSWEGMQGWGGVRFSFSFLFFILAVLWVVYHVLHR